MTTDVTPWIENLTHPLVLFGFVLFIFAGLLKLFKAEKVNGKETSKLLNKGLNFTFVLGLLIIVATLFKDSLPIFVQQAASTPSTTEQPATTQQTIKDTQAGGVAINAGGTVNYNAGGGSLATQTATQPTSEASAPTPVKQHIEGNSGIAINAGGDANVQQ